MTTEKKANPPNEIITPNNSNSNIIKRTSHVFKRTSRHQLSLAFSKLQEYAKFTSVYSPASEEELVGMQQEIDAFKQRLDSINFKTIYQESPQTAIDLLAGLRKVLPDTDYRTVSEMALMYHLLRVSSTYVGQDKTSLSWWYGSFKGVLAEVTNTGRGYQRNYCSLTSYKVCVSAWNNAKTSNDYSKIMNYAQEIAKIDTEGFISELTAMLQKSYESNDSTASKARDFSVTIETKHK
jgi:hypothetical protein